MIKKSRELNKAIISRLDGSGPRLMTTPRQIGWVRDFVGLPERAVEEAFGQPGRVLHETLSEMDPDHPDLEACLEEKIFEHRSLSTFVAVVGLVKLAADNRRDDLIGPLSRLDLLPKDLATAVPKSFVRCLRSPARRDEMRGQKKSQPIDLTTLARRGEELWNAQPDSFDSLVRYEDAYAAEIAAAERRAARFKNIGCTAMCAEIMKTVEAFRTQVADSYLGFNRLTFNAASVILAKWHDYNLVKPYILSDFPPERNYKVTVPVTKFDGQNVFAGGEYPICPWPYCPRIYPINELDRPPDVRKIIDLCEQYHGLGGKPIFDHYVAMVPGIDYPCSRSDVYSFRENGTLRIFTDLDEARAAFDKTLLSLGLISAAVMGERDGKCYFLCVWS